MKESVGFTVSAIFEIGFSVLVSVAVSGSCSISFSIFGKNKIEFSDLLFDAVWCFSGFSAENMRLDDLNHLGRDCIPNVTRLICVLMTR